MKTPTAKKLPSGMWFCRVRVGGKDIPITRPTQKQAIAEAMAIKAGIKDSNRSGSRTVSAAIDDYIAARQNVLSPATIAGYKQIKELRFQSIMGRDIFKITPAEWQRHVNLEAKMPSKRDPSQKISAKTLKNAWGLLSSVITDTTGQTVSVRLPQLVPHQKAWLTAEQIPVFVAAVKGDTVEIPALLALCSLRRSELLDLKWTDIDLEKGVLQVDGAAVYDEDRNLIRKRENKNPTSRRTVPMIPPLIEALRSADRTNEYIVTHHPNYLMARINHICEANGLPLVGFHGLRHSFASLAHHLGMPEHAVMEIGGWADFGTMRKIYTHISQADVKKHAESFTNFFDSATSKGTNPEQ